MLVKVPGTPLSDADDFEPFEYIRTIAVTRLMMPKSYVRLSAGREQMNEQMQALAFLAGANSIFYCDKLLTTSNPRSNEDLQLLEKLGIRSEEYYSEKSDSQREADLYRICAESRDDNVYYRAG